MDSTELQCIPRVSVKALQAQSHPTDVWELASENLTLSMCRHNVCVLELPYGTSAELCKLFDGLDDLLQVSASASGSSLQPLAAGEDEPGLLLLPGRHSYNFKLGSSKGDSLSAAQSSCFHQVQHCCQPSRLPKSVRQAKCQAQPQSCSQSLLQPTC